MQARFGAYVLFALFATPVATASAGSLPDIKSSGGNKVPECVTPGRLMAYLKSRNPEIGARFESVPSEYMRLGEDLGVRWDFAFYQMMLETGSLTFKAGGRSGDVKPQQNNFAGLGATGKGEPGESFPDVATGVRAHLEHLLLYSGQRLDNPVADRTRKVQEWGVLTPWIAGFNRPITYADLAAKWAPGSNAYVKHLEGLAQGFQEFCRRADPKPELLAAVRRARLAAAEPPAEVPPGEALARKAVADGKAEGDNARHGLGNPDAVSPSVTANLGNRVPPTPFKILNAPAPEPEAEAEPEPAPKANARAAQPPAHDPSPAFRSGMLAMPKSQPAPTFHNEASLPPPALPAASETEAPAAKAPSARASHPASAPPAQQPPAKAAAAQPPRKDAPTKVASAAMGAVPLGQKCRVWTASYGGQKTLIIRSIVDKVVNFTVLDVNDGAENREAEAFIAAYAKNGTVAGVFNNQATALDKAFELCPES